MITTTPAPIPLSGIPAGVTAADLELVARFEDATLADDAFGHPEHVRVAWVLLRSLPGIVALDRFATGLRRFAAAKGAAGLYHETITWAYLFLIHERIARHAEATTWDAFATANPDLLARGKAALHRYYSDEELGSELARRVFLFPSPSAVATREAA